jgi:transposase
MLSLSSSAKVYLAVGATDLRRSIDGLSVMVQMQFKLDPFNDGIFVFCNRACDKLKILYWYNNGFWLYYRRLERGRFKWPQAADGSETLCITERELSWLLDGFDIHEKGAHKAVKQRKII